MGRTPCRTAPRILKTSPSSQTITNWIERPSALLRRKFSTIWGEKTTTQHAMETELEVRRKVLVSHWIRTDLPMRQLFCQNVPADARNGLDVEIQRPCWRGHSLFSFYPSLLSLLSISLCVSLCLPLYLLFRVYGRSEAAGDVDSRSLRNRGDSEDARFLDARQCSLSNLAISVSPSEGEQKNLGRG